MTIPKLTPGQWLKLASALLPFLRGLVKVAGVGVVGLIRSLIDIVAQVEDLFPAELGPDGKPVKRGAEKAKAFEEIVIAAFATADQGLSGLQVKVGDITQAGAAIVALFNQWQIFKTASAT